jgi:Tfp pilus assembly protein PilZ
MERAITLNMSEGGAFISTHNLIGTGTALSLRLLLQDAYISVAGRVVHAIKEDRSNLSNIGVEFINRTSEYINRFNKEIDAITIYQRQSSDRNGREVSLAEASLNWYRNSPVWI